MSSVTAQELYQLRTYLQEAQHREQQIESKLATLQRLVSSTQVSSWQHQVSIGRETGLLSGSRKFCLLYF